MVLLAIINMMNAEYGVIVIMLKLLLSDGTAFRAGSR